MNDNDEINIFACAGMFVTQKTENKRYLFKPSKLKIWLYRKLYGYVWVDFSIRS